MIPEKRLNPGLLSRNVVFGSKFISSPPMTLKLYQHLLTVFQRWKFASIFWKVICGKKSRKTPNFFWFFWKGYHSVFKQCMSDIHWNFIKWIFLSLYGGVQQQFLKKKIENKHQMFPWILNLYNFVLSVCLQIWNLLRNRILNLYTCFGILVALAISISKCMHMFLNLKTKFQLHLLTVYCYLMVMWNKLIYTS